MIDLAKTTPTLLPEQLRELAVEAERLAVDPLNAVDNNPVIAREWIAVGGGFRMLAEWLERRFNDLFSGGC